ncbi:hypothetical protein Pelo_3495 [Pelomyxa schiedti]|nr:hypothetical protein Pelo_3495 [Pelomyxa schiedti]
MCNNKKTRYATTRQHSQQDIIHKDHHNARIYWLNGWMDWMDACCCDVTEILLLNLGGVFLPEVHRHTDTQTHKKFSTIPGNETGRVSCYLVQKEKLSSTVDLFTADSDSDSDSESESESESESDSDSDSESESESESDSDSDSEFRTLPTKKPRTADTASSVLHELETPRRVRPRFLIQKGVSCGLPPTSSAAPLIEGSHG